MPRPPAGSHAPLEQIEGLLRQPGESGLQAHVFRSALPLLAVMHAMGHLMRWPREPDPVARGPVSGWDALWMIRVSPEPLPLFHLVGASRKGLSSGQAQAG